MKISRRFGLLLAFLCLVAPWNAAADRVSNVDAVGIVETDRGTRLKLAGIEIPVEARALLSVLLDGKELEYNREPALPPDSQTGAIPVYLFVKTRQISVPLDNRSKLSQSKVLVNEMLLSLGAAQVVKQEVFKLKSRFLETQERARANGAGIWSYELSSLPGNLPRGDKQKENGL